MKKSILLNVARLDRVGFKITAWNEPNPAYEDDEGFIVMSKDFGMGHTVIATIDEGGVSGFTDAEEFLEAMGI